jgi:thiol-disulfide isomerase/thioredoxin
MKLSDIQNRIAQLAVNRKFLMGVFIVICFVIAALYAYRRYVVKPSYVSNTEYTSELPEQTAELYFFHTTWCPHCKKALPVWEELKNEVGDKPIKGYTVNFVEVDCEKDPGTAEKFKVTGYPTIKLIKGNQVIEYDAKPDKATLMEFLETSL